MLEIKCGPNCLLAETPLKLERHGKVEKKTEQREECRGCEKLESVFKMHVCLNFSLLPCHCFEKSKLCLQKLKYTYV